MESLVVSGPAATRGTKITLSLGLLVTRVTLKAMRTMQGAAKLNQIKRLIAVNINNYGY